MVKLLALYAVGAEKDHMVSWDAVLPFSNSWLRRALRARVEWSHCGHH